MKLWSETFRDGGLMPADHAFAEIDPDSRVRLAGNRNPHLAWDEGTERHRVAGAVLHRSRCAAGRQPGQC